ncbi:MAG: hypothetical protein AXA67_12955 [Methylothermaceae bacteria B42]|nr:MAG: hypothetical protein AXA67_12955 [Methylothermaceae bacteria B42]HHJ38467.1 hypothetical protein [Methylothermaceae bacterium]
MKLLRLLGPWYRGFLFFSLVLFGSGQLHATAIRQVNLEEMLRQSELVFDGVVVNTEVKENAYGRLATEITFKVIDVLKGDPGGSTITLVFMGGTKDGKTLKVGEMDYPAIGERGIYFVESLKRRLVNPLFGWSQGRFIVIKDEDGTHRVYTAQKTPVTGLISSPIPPSRQFSRGVAQGVQTSKQALTKNALSIQQFKRQLKEKWETIQ